LEAALMAGNRCEKCPSGLMLPGSVLHDCTHCGRRFCSVHIVKHAEDVELHLKTVPQAMRPGGQK
jgi:predicted nucleic acid binding AN1-type Zn finger protein